MVQETCAPRCEQCGRFFKPKRSWHVYRFCSVKCRSVALGKRSRKGPAEFWAKVRKTGWCWLWLGSRYHRYGYFQAAGQRMAAHRYAYELVVGPVPSGLELDHLCGNRYCVNPAHLEAVTHQVNVARGGLAEANRRRKK